MDENTINQFKQTISRLAVTVATTLNSMEEQAKMRAGLKKWISATIEVCQLIVGTGSDEEKVLRDLFVQLDNMDWEAANGSEE